MSRTGRHDESQPAGIITNLGYDKSGHLRICAHTDVMARRCNAFSVGARILEYSIVDADNANFHALISSAEICEISLTDRPANPQALVRSRDRAVMGEYIKTLHDHSDLAIRGVRVIQRQLEMLQQMMAAPANSQHIANFKPDRAPRPAPRPRVEPYRQSEFGRLISQLEQRRYSWHYRVVSPCAARWVDAIAAGAGVGGFPRQARGMGLTIDCRATATIAGFDPATLHLDRRETIIGGSLGPS